jgi:RNA-directed DNA polymerase
MTPLLQHLDCAYHWLCRQRKHYPAYADVWCFRGHWAAERLRLQAEIAQGTPVTS